MLNEIQERKRKHQVFESHSLAKGNKIGKITSSSFTGKEKGQERERAD
jgi:hypothetical protein